MEKIFIWNNEFETGLPKIDEEHHHLVDLINQFAELMMDNKVHENDVAMLYKELTDYTHYHFQDEESLMQKEGIHPSYIKSHQKSHNFFIKQLNIFKAQINLNSPEICEMLLNFLYEWLGYHILENDQDIPEQIDMIRKGVSSEDAMKNVTGKARGKSIDPFMHALNNIIALLSEKNDELDELNQGLERKVEERTQELEEANKKLEYISLTDPLTSLPNRRHAMQHLDALWEKSVNEKTFFSCLMIDADYFKEVNDTFGHDAGDTVLKELSVVLNNNIRTDDFLARLGGDEFLVLCEKTDLDGAVKLGNLLLENVLSMNVKLGNSGKWKSSISIGAASKGENTIGPEELIKNADKSLYEAKEDGRSCIRGV